MTLSDQSGSAVGAVRTRSKWKIAPRGNTSPAPEIFFARAMQDDAPPPRERRNGDTLILFDVDGTLTVPAQRADDAMVSLLALSLIHI